MRSAFGVTVSLLVIGLLAAWHTPLLASDGATQITFDAAVDRTPCWSPDGSQIAFASNRGASMDVWRIPATGGPASQVTSNPSTDWEPAWSPEGSQIAYGSSHAIHGFSLGIFVIDPGGGVAAELASGGFSRPSWSPDGTQLTFEAHNFGECISDEWQIVVMPATGGEITPLSQRPDECHFDRAPSWVQFYAALNDMLRGDAGPLAAVWSQGADVSTMHPIGGREIGWEQVKASWENVAGIASDGKVELKDQVIRVVGNLAYETGTEQGHFTLGGHNVPEFQSRVTNIYEREDRSWKIVHHHVDVSQAMVDVLRQLPPPAESGQ